MSERRWRAPFGLTLRGYWWAVALAAGGAQLLTIELVVVGALAEAWQVAMAALWVGSVLVAALLIAGTTRAVDRSVKLTQDLAAAAREVAGSLQVRIPHADRSDEIGELARALQAWQRASLERDVVIQQAPIGICELDRQRRVIVASPGFPRMLGIPPEQVKGQLFRSFVYEPDLDPEKGTPLADLIAGTVDRVTVEHRMVRGDGSLLWCSATTTALRGADGMPERFLAIVEDISERRQQLERAAEIQRGLLPETTPELDGYDLAGACRPARDAAGDLYDWSLSEDGRLLDLTVADVMGKGVGPGLMMATLRAVLRSAPGDLGPAARVRLAANFLSQAAGEQGLFVTTFHGRLELSTGVLHYVDAGHGYAAVLRAGGDLVHLRVRSLPAGIWPDQVFREGTIGLEPGDTLLLYSDGLVQTEDRTGDLSEFADDLAATTEARETVWRLMRRVPRRPLDDVTVLALRRLPPAQGRTADGAPFTWPADEPDLELTPRTPHPLDFAPPAPIGDREAPPTPGASPHVLGFLPAETQRQGVTASVIFGIGMHLLLVLLVTAGILARSTAFTVGALLIGSAVVASLTAVGIGGNQLAGGALGSLADLARAAREIADGGQVRIPDVERSDEFGELARALAAWQRASAARETMVQQAPLGIMHLDHEGRITRANVALNAMLGYLEGALLSRPLLDLVHPQDREKEASIAGGLARGTLDQSRFEVRYLRLDGDPLWCSTTLAALRGPDGEPEGFVAIVVDVSETRQLLQRAAQIQRGLLPQGPPQLDGYDLAGACRPAQEVAGDFYDWRVSEDGQLELTVADVMGKGMGPGLVMATVRAVLRAAPAELGPAARVRLAGKFLTRGVGDEGLFVTLFHARLDLAAGRLRYVDAGHGYATVRRADGQLVHLSERSMPLGIWPEQDFIEGEVGLEPGDTLIVYSDGLVETDGRTGNLGDYAGELEGAADAQETVWGLMRHLPGHLQDDVTVLALHRSASDPDGSSTPRTHQRARHTSPLQLE